MILNIVKLSSTLHNQEQLFESSQKLFNDLQQMCTIKINFVESKKIINEKVKILFIETGGVESIFLHSFKNIPGPFYLITTDENNSLAAAIEILSFLQNNNVGGSIIHGSMKDIADNLVKFAKINNAFNLLKEDTLGVIGKPSDWLIASNVDYQLVKRKLGINLIDIPINSVKDEIQNNTYPKSEYTKNLIDKQFDQTTVIQALDIYGALNTIKNKYQLNGLTLRCFDLLPLLSNTGCLGLALLNALGIPSSCEGDIPILLAQMIVRHLLDKPSFQVNPSSIDIDHNELIFAHCTIPLNMVQSFTLKSHFESKIGVAISAKLKENIVTIFRINNNLTKYYISTGTIICNLQNEQRCRTQIKVRIDNGVEYFTKYPLGNHHLIIEGDCKELLESFLQILIQGAQDE